MDTFYTIGNSFHPYLVNFLINLNAWFCCLVWKFSPLLRSLYVSLKLFSSSSLVLFSVTLLLCEDSLRKFKLVFSILFLGLFFLLFPVQLLPSVLYLSSLTFRKCSFTSFSSPLVMIFKSESSLAFTVDCFSKFCKFLLDYFLMPSNNCTNFLIKVLILF